MLSKMFPFNIKTFSSFLLCGSLVLSAVLTGTQGQPWQARHGLTSSAYQTEFNTLVGEGYRLTYVDGYGVNNVDLYAAIWQQIPSPPWVARHGMTSSQYQAQFDALVNQGYRLNLVSGYTINGSDLYAAIWDKSTGPDWVAKHGLTSTEYQSAFNNYTSQGFRLKHVSGYAIGTDARYAALWEKSSGPAWAARHGLTADQYQSAFNAYVGQGYRLVLVDSYTVNGIDLYAAIWEQSTGPAWVARHGLTSQQYQTVFNQLVSQGYKLICVAGNGSDLYAALWSQ